MENNTNNMNMDVLESLRQDYVALKQQLDSQQIINERLLMRTFSSKVSNINSKGWISQLCGLVVIIASPFAFHFNPALNASWAFVIGTDIMMLVSIFFTWKFHHGIAAPTDSCDDIITFANKISRLKKQYKDWTNAGIVMITVWFVWLMIELYMHNTDSLKIIGMASGLTVGLAIGGIIGLGMNKKVINNCDEILSDIESIK